MKYSYAARMKKQLSYLSIRMRIGVAKVMQRSRQAVNNEDGMGTIELVLLICVLIALALMFKDTIVDFVEGLLGNISSQETVFDPGAIAK